MESPLEQKYKIIISVQFISAAALILFWAGYYSLPLFGLALPALYDGILNAFPLPDTVLAVFMLAAGFMISLRHKSGIWLSFLVAGMLVYLGIAGFSLELPGGMLLISMVSVLKSGFVNLWCIIFGLYFLLKLIEKKNKKESASKI